MLVELPNVLNNNNNNNNKRSIPINLKVHDVEKLQA